MFDTATGLISTAGHRAETARLDLDRRTQGRDGTETARTDRDRRDGRTDTDRLMPPVSMSSSRPDFLFGRLQDALKESNVVQILKLIKNDDVDVNQRDVADDLQTILMKVCYASTDPASRRQILEVLISKGADVNAQDACGRSVMMHACLSQRPDVLSYLIDNTHAQLTLLDFDGNSVLAYAVEWGSPFAVKQILAHSPGDSLAHTHNCHGQTPRDIATQLNNKDICAILDRHTNVFEKSPGKIKPRTKGDKSSNRFAQTFSGSSTQREDKMPSNSDGSLDVSKGCYFDPSTRDGKQTGQSYQLSHSVSNASMSRLSRERDLHLHQSPFTMRKQGSKISMRSMEERKMNSDDDSWKFKFGRRRGSLSLPDLRDMTGCLVNSGETTPSSNSPSTFDNDLIDEEFDVSRVHPIDRYSKKVLQKEKEPVSLPSVGVGPPCLCSPQIERSSNVRNSKKSERLQRNLLLPRTS
ncbi:hypothetical protein ScPMuIL_002650 [Solemya velum]